ncbi:glycosyltransferase 87 family protein [Plantactinospora sp. KLBMP9567]|uniref:glycosyltransferase 87 family protein n=1 Tax=Plantactinospora sp. KLBMP9567 TaxID=3085900 RepID=UPI0029816A4B|nr:glycosyltransferase 87 family protein [Plantactinospora sp. KLBMP9567]MDW5326499.1 glycosyltransferase 87 family protein [Plantactinospora sp. KLBMP9567]
MGSRRGTTALWGVFGVIAVVSSALVLRRPDWERLSDLHIYHGAVRHLHAGQPLYEFVAENGGPFTYPPFAALVLSPIGLLPEGVLQLCWLVLTCAAVAAIAIAVGGAVTSRRHRRPLVVAAIACALMLSAPAQSNLRFGQVSVFIVLLALVDGAGLTPARYRGVLVGIAAAVKLTPLLFVVFFLVSRRWRDAGRAAGAFLACGLIGAVVLPADSWTFWTGTFLNTSRVGNLASLGNQSLHGMLLRVGAEGDTFPLLWAGLVLVVCGTALLRARQLELSGRSAQAAVLVGCATVAASPVSWTHHQIWPVLAAMFLVGSYGVARRVAGVAVLCVMVLSLGALLSSVSMTPGLQFLFENSRSLATITLCLAGFGGVAVAAVAAGRRTSTVRSWLRVGAAALAGVAFFAVQPLPAGADPTFKAYSMSDVHNPRYFFVCRSAAECAAFRAGAPITFGVTAEKTKVRVNGVVDATVARLEYQSAPGGAARTIPLLEVYPGQWLFSFRSANLSHGRLTAYRADGSPIAAYSEELATG